MKICETKNWSSDDWKALSEDAQLDELAWHEHQTERRMEFLELMESKLPRNKDNAITSPEGYAMILLAKMELL